MGLIIGLDMCDAYTQLSCYEKEKVWTFPTIICRCKSEEEWYVGKEAYACNLVGDGILVDKLLNLVSREGTATIDGVKYEAIRLLELFMERVLKLPKKELEEEEIDQLVITLPSVTGKVMDSFLYCGDYLEIPREKVHIISHEESFVYYILNQKKEIWRNQVGLFDLSPNRLCYYELKVQRGLQKMMVVAESFNLEESFDLDILGTPSGARLADKILCSCGERLLGRKLFSTIILSGKGFEKQDWSPEFMKLICHRRKVYAETALFSKGAAFRGAEYFEKKEESSFTCICEGRLKSTISMEVVYKDRKNQLVIAGAGENWYECRTSMDFILDDSKTVEFTVTPMDPKKKRRVVISLKDFPDRPARTTKIQMKIGFLDESTMVVAIRDLGFGELFPASDTIVRQEVKL
ncbi:MAG: hypothetical protein HFG42_00315 [Lachnospiraceae bacterium]|jgi:hypothetical protein|nr:hypothetical protein [Lachnospiraceae bacterium]